MATPPITPRVTYENASSSKTASYRPVHMILDFDSTITEADTTYLLPEIARASITNPVRKQGLLVAWEECVEKYTFDVKEHTNKYSSKESPASLRKIILQQRSLRTIEDLSATRCGALGLLQGLTSQQWREAGRKACESAKVRIRWGFRALIEDLTSQGTEVSRWGVVSVNWSHHFLRGVLGYALGSDATAGLVPVLANHIDPTFHVVYGPRSGPIPNRGYPENTPEITNKKRILSSLDKLEAMKSMLGSFTGSIEDQNRTREAALTDTLNLKMPGPLVKPLVVYIGDSLTDLECLLEADVGIIMASDGTGNLMDSFGRCNEVIPHISFYVPQETKSLWFAQDFRDVVASRLLDGLRSLPTNEREKIC